MGKKPFLHVILIIIMLSFSGCSTNLTGADDKMNTSGINSTTPQETPSNQTASTQTATDQPTSDATSSNQAGADVTQTTSPTPSGQEGADVTQTASASPSSQATEGQTTGTLAGKSDFGSKLTVGAHYYPWYGPGHHWDEGYLRSKLQPSQQPYLGQYDSGDPKVTEQQIRWAKDYGLDYFIMSWWGPDKFEDNNIKNGFLKSANIADIKFGILYETPGRLGFANDSINFNEKTGDILIRDFEYLAETYFKNPSYLNYNGKPVVYFYLSRCFKGDYVSVIQNLRNDIKEKFGMELFLIGDEIYWGGTYLADQKVESLDAFSLYNPHNNDNFSGTYMNEFDDSSNIAQLYEDALQSAKNAGTFFIPDAMPGFNDRGVRLETNHEVIPREMNEGETGSESTFKDFLELAYKYRDPVLNTILVTSWNEWHEDSQIEPLAEGEAAIKPDELTKGFSYAAYGFKDLEILKAFKDEHK